jgi:fatty-acyl-CoA synthase
MSEIDHPIDNLSIIHGMPLNEEEGIGALTLGAYLQEVCERYSANEAAVQYVDGVAERWTYGDLWQRSVEIARALLACGVTKGTRVGVMMTNRLEFLSSVFGTALTGGIATTISTFSTKNELEFILQQSDCAVLLLERNILKKDFVQTLLEIEPALAQAVPGQLQSRTLPFLKHVATVDSTESQGAIESWADFLAHGEATPVDMVAATAQRVNPADPGVLFFSSGSTGKPKGILSAHRGVCLQLWRWRKWLALEEGVRSWSANGFFWSGNFAIGIGGTFSIGGSLVLQQTFQPEEALSLMEKEKVSYLFAWPHQWAQLTDAKNWLDVDLSAMHYIDMGSPIAKHPTINTDYIEPAHAYGNTETFTLSSVYPAHTPKAVSAGSHGIPAAGNTLKIVDPLSGKTVALGERGEIALKGPTLMLGYIGVPLDETLDEEGFFRTGDGGYMDSEGRLYWEGRLNDIIKTGGANVSPVEVDILLATHPAVKVTKTIGVADELLGEIVVACIVPLEGTSPSEDDIRNFAKEQLASYKVPRKVLFFTEDELSLTGSAKVKSDDLRELAVKRLEAENS